MWHERTIDAARGKWRGILMELGVSGDMLRNRPSACPVCGGKDRFRFDDQEGRGTSICNQCGARSGMQLAQEVLGGDFASVAARIDAMLGNLTADTPRASRPEMTDTQRREMLRAMWAESRPIQPGDLAHRYLASRHIEERVYPATLRFHPALRDGEGGLRPAILAMMAVAGEAKGCAIHRTYLRPDGSGKADMTSPRKITAGTIPDGAGVALSEWHGSGPIGIAEGIETAMSASALYDMPVWSALTAGMLAKWRPPEGADEVAIFGDNDPGFAGQAAAYALARRLHAKGLPVTVHIPPQPGEDWADIWVRRAVNA